ncbi:MAG: YceD family protein [Gammaproteobacteria bacterium]|nr:YceD family protein [Gammaproteobacteria bacterium]
MNQSLPVHLNFAQKAKIGFEIHGKLPIKQLKRLSESLLSGEGDIEVDLKFERVGPVPYIHGHIKTDLQLKCQRCMQSMPYVVDVRFKLGLVQNEAQMEKLPDDAEPYLIETDNNHLPDMLEEELLLALPLVAMHEFDCSDFLQQQKSAQQNEVEVSEEKENPFSVLKDLL